MEGVVPACSLFASCGVRANVKGGSPGFRELHPTL
jgi:hypothetical protein